MKYILTIAFFIVMISGCAPEAVDDSSEPTAVSLSRSSELEEKDLQPGESISEGELEEKDVQPGESISEGDLVADSGSEAAEPPASQGQEGELVAPSGSVDLSEVTSPSSASPYTFMK